MKDLSFIEEHKFKVHHTRYGVVYYDKEDRRYFYTLQYNENMAHPWTWFFAVKRHKESPKHVVRSKMKYLSAEAAWRDMRAATPMTFEVE